MKTCSICQRSLPKGQFYARKEARDGLRKDCKKCVSDRSRRYYSNNSDDVKSRVKEYRGKEVSKARRREHYRENIEAMRTQKRMDYQKHKKKRISGSLEYKRRKRIEDPVYALENRCRARLHYAFKAKGYKRNSKVSEMLGCSYNELLIHIESQFSPGMTWDNRGKWHLDHIVPLSSARNEDELIKLCHYTNLQPLWAEENFLKGSKHERDVSNTQREGRQ